MIGNSIKSTHEKNLVCASFYNMYGLSHYAKVFRVESSKINNRIALDYAFPVKSSTEKVYIDDQDHEQCIIYPSNASLILGLLDPENPGCIESVHKLKTGEEILPDSKDYNIINDNMPACGKSAEYFVAAMYEGVLYPLFYRDSDDEIHKLSDTPVFDDYKMKMTTLRIDGTSFTKVKRIKSIDTVTVDTITFREIKDLYYPILHTIHGSFRCQMNEYLKHNIGIGSEIIIDMDYEGIYHLDGVRIKGPKGSKVIPVCSICGQQLILENNKLYHAGVCTVDECHIRTKLDKLKKMDLDEWNSFTPKEKNDYLNDLVHMSSYKLNYDQVNCLDKMIRRYLGRLPYILEFYYIGMPNYKKQILGNRIRLIYRILFK